MISIENCSIKIEYLYINTGMNTNIEIDSVKSASVNAEGTNTTVAMNVNK